jgi:hypothetical protein
VIASIEYISFLKLSGWIIIVLGGWILLKTGVRLYLRLFKCPQYMFIHNNKITVTMLFTDTFLINISEVNCFRYDPWLSLFVQSGGWLYSQNHRRLFIGKPFFYNLNDFVEAIKMQYGGCTIDERLLQWDGRKHVL